MKRPDYRRDADGRTGANHSTLLKIADSVRLGNHEAATSLTTGQLDAMTNFVVETTGENRAQIARQAPAYVATRYSLARRSSDTPATIQQPSAGARAEQTARQEMIESSKNASRPKRHTDRAPAATPREMEQRARAAMERDSVNAWRKGRK
jgi:hypothetical protein